jgi:hypothetical protein
MQCTKCNSENTQRLEVVFDHGTQSISTTSHSAGAGIGGSLGVGGVRTSTSGTSQSTLAAKAAPPEKKTLMWPIVAVIVGVFFFGGGLGAKIFGALLVAGGGLLTYGAIKFNSEEWPRLYQYWKESWLCNKCGTIYHQP